jgi:hypothetical protein
VSGPRPKAPALGWMKGLLFGARLAITGGREAWIRTALTAVGVGIGVVLLFSAASIPHMIAARDARTSARDYKYLGGKLAKPGDDTLLILDRSTEFRDESISIRLVKAEGPDAPIPPGLDRVPAAGEAYASPALVDLLDSPEGALLRPRLPSKFDGEIGQAGLAGPAELTYYAGVDGLTVHKGASRIDGFGVKSNPEQLGAVLNLLLVVAIVVLLLPVGIFIATAARFGSDRRDRRLAALRLVGADAMTTRRIAAGESLFAALLGLAAGVLAFLLARLFIERITLFDVSVFSSDLAPNALLALVVAVSVPGAAVVASMIGMRSVVVEPLGVVRRSGLRRRRLGWRLVLPVLSLLLLYPLIGSLGRGTGNFDPFRVAAGVTFLLISVATLLPWIVEAVVGRLGSRGSVPLLLAARRLQIEGGSSPRAVSCVAVAIAGAIALQAVFSGAEAQQVTVPGIPGKPALSVFADASHSSSEVQAALTATPGAASVATSVAVGALRPKGGPSVGGFWVASCRAIEVMTNETGCQNGDTYLSTYQGHVGKRLAKLPGENVRVGAGDSAEGWMVPKDARPLMIDADIVSNGVVATPAAVRDLQVSRIATSVGSKVVLDPNVEDAADYVRNAGASFGPLTSVYSAAGLPEQVNPQFAQVRRAILAGVVGTLILIGASLLVTAMEQLRERRRAIAALIAFGATRGSLVRSVMWQAAVPVVLGIALAVVTGLVLGSILLKMAELPLSFDWMAVLGFSVAGALVVAFVTLLTLPLLATLSRPSQLRME